MARPLEETPIITGEDARKFLQRMKEVKPLPEEELAQIKSDYEAIMKITDWS